MATKVKPEESGTAKLDEESLESGQDRKPDIKIEGTPSSPPPQVAVERRSPRIESAATPVPIQPGVYTGDTYWNGRGICGGVGGFVLFPYGGTAVFSEAFPDGMGRITNHRTAIWSVILALEYCRMHTLYGVPVFTTSCYVIQAYKAWRNDEHYHRDRVNRGLLDVLFGEIRKMEEAPGARVEIVKASPDNRYIREAKGLAWLGMAAGLTSRAGELRASGDLVGEVALLQEAAAARMRAQSLMAPAAA